MNYKRYYLYCIYLLLFFTVNTFSQNEVFKLITSVKYVSAENVYLNTGTVSGIQIGDKFTVFRNPVIIS